MRIFIVVYERLDIIAVITFQPVCGSQLEEALSVLIQIENGVDRQFV